MVKMFQILLMLVSGSLGLSCLNLDGATTAAQPLKHQHLPAQRWWFLLARNIVALAG